MREIALVGTGSFAHSHASALSRIPGVRIKYVVGSEMGRTRQLADRVAAVALVSLDDAIQDPDLDAVDICNRTPRHAPDAIAALRAGKHAHVDKPAALTVAEFDAMTAAADSAGVRLAVGQTVRFQPVVAAAREAVARGEVGSPRLLHLSWYTGHVWPGGWRGWQLDVASSGGHPVHNGVHILDAATWLLGSPPVEVMARGFRTFSPDLPIPDSFTIIMRAANGAMATLELCYALQQPGRSIRRLMLAGTGGTVFHDTEQDPGLTSAAHTAPPASVEGALDAQLGEWVASLDGGNFRVRNDEVRSTLAAAIAAQQSLESGEPVRVAQREGVVES